MIRALQSFWFTTFAGCALFLAVTAALIKPGVIHLPPIHSPVTQAANLNGPSWQFRNPEFDQWVDDLRHKHDALALREQQLQELQTRLETERQQINTATQTVSRLQAEFDKSVIRFKSQEISNVRRQARVLAGMNPDNAATVVNEMSDDDAVRILVTMKPDEASAVLESLSRFGQTEAKRAADLTSLMRRVLPPAIDPRSAPPS